MTINLYYNYLNGKYTKKAKRVGLNIRSCATN